MNAVRWVSGGLTVAVEIQNDVLVLDFAGLVTAAAVNAFAVSMPALVEGERFHALLAMFDRAHVWCSASNFTRPFGEESVKDRLEVPGAIICKEADMPTFQEHGRQCVKRGIVRFAFDVSDLPDAVAWTQQKVEAARLHLLASAGHPQFLRAFGRG